jgi:hypothetical protein
MQKADASINIISKGNVAIEITPGMTVPDYLLELEKIVGTKDRWTLGHYRFLAQRVDINMDEWRHYADAMLLKAFSSKNLSALTEILNLEPEEVAKLQCLFELEPGTIWRPAEMERLRRTVHANVFLESTVAHELQHHADRAYMHLYYSLFALSSIVTNRILDNRELHETGVAVVIFILLPLLLQRLTYDTPLNIFEERARAAGRKASETNKVRTKDLKVYEYLEG